MSITVRDAMSPVVLAVPAQATLVEAAATMSRHGGGMLPVVRDDGTYGGMLRPSLIVRAVGAGLPPDRTAVEAIAVPDDGIPPDMLLEDVEPVLQERAAGAIPVVEENRLIGTLGPADLRAHALLSEELGARASTVSRVVSPRDGMHGGWLGFYMLSAGSAMRAIRNGLAAAGRDEVRSVLDFPCGHGRVMRVLRVAYPQARLTACDLSRDGVDFCAREFGAIPVYSDDDATKVEFAERFDLIWCGSLFTHLPEPRWAGFLELLSSSLAPGGALVMTVFGPRPDSVYSGLGVAAEQLEPMRAALDRDGIGFAPTVSPDWGLTSVTEPWLRTALTGSGLRVVAIGDREWETPRPRQDVVTCVPAGPG